MSIDDSLQPKWKHSNWEVRLAAVAELTDQALLADIAKNERDWRVRNAAVECLTDQTLLADIAKNDEAWSVRKAAVSRVTDQSVLAHIAKNDEVPSVRKAAIARVTDRGILADIAKSNMSVGRRAGGGGETGGTTEENPNTNTVAPAGATAVRTRESLLMIPSVRVSRVSSVQGGAIDVGDIYLTESGLFFIAYASATVYGPILAGGLVGAAISTMGKKETDEDEMRKAIDAYGANKKLSWGMSLAERCGRYGGSIFLERNGLQLETTKNDRGVVLRRGKCSCSFENISRFKLGEIREWIGGRNFFDADTIGAFLQVPSPAVLIEMLLKADSQLEQVHLDDTPNTSRYLAVFSQRYHQLDFAGRRTVARNIGQVDDHLRAELTRLVSYWVGQPVQRFTSPAKIVGIAGTAICSSMALMFWYMFAYHGNEPAPWYSWLMLAVFGIGALGIWAFAYTGLEILKHNRYRKEYQNIQRILDGKQ